MPQESQLADKIIRDQELIIGPVAWEQAQKVTGLRINIQSHEVDIEGDARDVLERLVAQYEKLFGKASREVCRDAVRPLLSQVPESDVPAVLR
ncbi:MAG: hypothetical protein A3E36_02240 [Candidatus Andersenbacteria bacterium RIFCSPHIGHO2_12_FULL_45_11b]|uniref:Uncharacterized protein n=2 Tax=Parcubacteria group TaxID=1794811 RepID=A0A1G2FU08_9BACT|nr:MAG: hypothetical protein A3E36_02240 [Candidatus Andersenbacteria bacterium RIFCSPHIGHO2_12_FULL_45_11b]OGZ41575.1 MAG: hypothetical protein A2W41_00465 [Candidatus Ryanbacteria bacterium RIFCSPHIGHO2_01_45_13]